MTIDLEQRLRTDLPRLADLLEGETTAEVCIPRTRRRYRTRLIALGAVVCVAIAVIAAVAVRAPGHHQSESVSTPPSALSDTWHVLPPSGLGPRGNAVVVWTGSEVLVWGGYRGDPNVPLAFQNGAAYDPASGKWHTIADNQWAHPGAVGVWAGDRLYVLAKNGGAMYTPAADTWRDIARLPDSSGSFIGGTWSGDTLYGVVAGRDSQTIQIATYDATHDTWTVGVESSPPWPDVGRIPVAYLDGAVFVSDMHQTVWRFAPAAGTWSTEPGLPAGTTTSSIVAIDDSIVAVGVTRDGTLTANRDDGHEWNTIARPAPTAIHQPIPIDGDGSLLVVDSAGQATPLRLDNSAHTWIPLTGYPLEAGVTTTPVWASTGLFVWGGLPALTTIAPPTSTNSQEPTRPEAAWYGP